MKKRFSLLLALLCACVYVKSQVDSLTVYYYENFPYSFTEKGKLKGIEIDIADEYVQWLKTKKGISVIVSYKPYSEFGSFYTSVKEGGSKVIGLGSVTNTQDREKEVSFTAPYLHNLAVLITDGSVATIKSKTAADIGKVLGNMSAIVVNKSSHVNYMNEIKKTYLPNLKIGFTEKQSNVLESITTDKKIFGFVDIVAYWSYLKQNPTKFLKMQKAISEPKESLGFILPKSNLHGIYLSEFFESGFGFTATKTYHQILEKYLGYEILDDVEVK